eukprot:3133360-Amphidinium_carterae.3
MELSSIHRLPAARNKIRDSGGLPRDPATAASKGRLGMLPTAIVKVSVIAVTTTGSTELGNWVGNWIPKP